jgi:hypothetical protein
MFTICSFNSPDLDGYQGTRENKNVPRETHKGWRILWSEQKRKKSDRPLRTVEPDLVNFPGPQSEKIWRVKSWDQRSGTARTYPRRLPRCPRASRVDCKVASDRLGALPAVPRIIVAVKSEHSNPTATSQQLVGPRMIFSGPRTSRHRRGSLLLRNSRTAYLVAVSSLCASLAAAGSPQTSGIPGPSIENGVETGKLRSPCSSRQKLSRCGCEGTLNEREEWLCRNCLPAQKQEDATRLRPDGSGDQADSSSEKSQLRLRGGSPRIRLVRLSRTNEPTGDVPVDMCSFTFELRTADLWAGHQ